MAPSAPERGLILGHAWTVWLGQIAVMAFGIVDTVVAGRYSNDSLAALSVGTAIYISVYVALIGVVQALLPLFAGLRGAGRWRALGTHVKQAGWLCLALMLMGMVVMLWPAMLLQATGVPQDLQPAVHAYLGVLAWALPAAIFLRLFSTLHQALGKPRLVTLIQIAGLVLKLPLSAGLTFGLWGLPELGVQGCAWATWGVNHVMLGLALGLVLRQDFYRPMRLLSRWRGPDVRVLGLMLRLGVPAGLSYLVEVTSFTMMAMYIARMGSVSSAAHQIAANVTAVMYMVPLSFSIATSARVGYWLGAARPDMARRAMWDGFALLGPVAALMSLTLWTGAGALAGVYSQDAAVQAMATALLGWVALYHLADAVQVMCGFVLRCHRITLAPFGLYATFLWGLGLLGGYWLCYGGLSGIEAMHSPHAFWMTGAAALYGVALCLLGLLVYNDRRPSGASIR